MGSFMNVPAEKYDLLSAEDKAAVDARQAGEVVSKLDVISRSENEVVEKKPANHRKGK